MSESTNVRTIPAAAVAAIPSTGPAAKLPPKMALKVSEAVKKWGGAVENFFTQSRAADIAQENMSQATVKADAAKRAAIDAITYAMLHAGFKSGFPSAEAKAAFKAGFLTAAGAAKYRQGYADNLWSQLMTSTTAHNGQTFKVVSDDAVKKAAERTKAEKEAQALLKRLGVEHATPDAIKAEAAKLVTTDTKLAKTLLDTADKRERQQAKEQAELVTASLKASRAYLVSVVKAANGEQLAALIAVAKKLNIKPAASK